MLLFLTLACDPEATDRCGTPRDESPSTLDIETPSGEWGATLAERLLGDWAGTLTWADTRVTDVAIQVGEGGDPYTCARSPNSHTDVYAPMDWRLPVTLVVETTDGGLHEALVGTLVVNGQDPEPAVFTDPAPLSGTAGDGSPASFELTLGETTLDGSASTTAALATFTTDRADGLRRR